MELFDSGGSGRILYEIGAAVKYLKPLPLWNGLSLGERDACERAMLLYERCNEEGKRGVLCWLWLAREEHVVKDICLLIADVIWSDRTLWSERLTSADLARDAAPDVAAVAVIAAIKG